MYGVSTLSQSVSSHISQKNPEQATELEIGQLIPNSITHYKHHDSKKKQKTKNIVNSKTI